jgi:hypothetical protein
MDKISEEMLDDESDRVGRMKSNKKVRGMIRNYLAWIIMSQ